eukprot:1351887-Prymnesium_polylepis.1
MGAPPSMQRSFLGHDGKQSQTRGTPAGCPAQKPAERSSQPGRVLDAGRQTHPSAGGPHR